MATLIKEVPGFKQVATGDNIQKSGSEYRVSNIAPYPNDDLIMGNTYNISDPSHHGIVVSLKSPPGGGMRTAIFEPQS